MARRIPYSVAKAIVDDNKVLRATLEMLNAHLRDAEMVFLQLDRQGAATSTRAAYTVGEAAVRTSLYEHLHTTLTH